MRSCAPPANLGEIDNWKPSGQHFHAFRIGRLAPPLRFKPRNTRPGIRVVVAPGCSDHGLRKSWLLPNDEQRPGHILAAAVWRVVVHPDLHVSRKPARLDDVASGDVALG